MRWQRGKNGAKRGTAVSLKTDRSGTLVEWRRRLFSRGIKACVLPSPSTPHLGTTSGRKRAYERRKLDPTVIMVRLVSPINLIALKSPSYFFGVPSGRNRLHIIFFIPCPFSLRRGGSNLTMSKQ